MKHLVKSASLMGSAEIAMIFVAIARTKYLAVTIGPAGFGSYALMSSFFVFMSAFAGYWLASPTVKYISEYNSNNDKKSVQMVFDFSFSFVFLLTTILTIIFFIFAKFIKNEFLSPEIIFLHYALFAASFIGTSLTSVFDSTFQALKLVKKVILIRIISNLFNLLSVFILVFFFDLTGFFINILASSLFLLFLFWKEGKKIVKIRIIKLNFKENIIKKLISFGSVNIFLSIVNLLGEYLLRIIIISYTSMSVLGLFHAATGLSQYLGIIYNGTFYYYRPKMAENLKIDERNRVLNDYLRVVLLSGIFISSVAILFGRLAIGIFYTKSFLPLADVFYIFVIAQFLLTIKSAFAAIITGMAKLKAHSVLVTILHILVVVIPLLFIKKYGLWAIGFGSVFAITQNILVSFVYLKKQVKINLRSDTIMILLMSILFLGLSVVMKDALIYYKFVIVFVLCTLLYFNLKKSEKKFVLNYIETKMKLIIGRLRK